MTDGEGHLKQLLFYNPLQNFEALFRQQYAWDSNGKHDTCLEKISFSLSVPFVTCVLNFLLAGI